jgi:hypothetical protein
VSASRANPFAGIQAIKTDGTLWGTGQIAPIPGGGAFSGGTNPAPAIINTSSLTAVPSGFGPLQPAYSSPVQVGTSSWTQVSASVSYVAALTVGNVYTWGFNIPYAGGIARSSPIQINSGGTTTAVAAANSFLIFVGSGSYNYRDGAASGTLGVGITFTSAVAGVGTVFMLDNTGLLYATGDNTYGQLGNGTTTNVTYTSFVQIGT